MEKNPYSGEDLEYFKNLLFSRRKEAEAVENELENEALRKRSEETGDLSAVPIHMADVSSDTFEQEIILKEMESEQALIRDIDRALEKIEAGTYGYCEEDEKAISRERLEAVPWARYCLACETRKEQR